MHEPFAAADKTNRYARFARSAGLFVIGVSILVGLGWLVGSEILIGTGPRWSVMKPVTALGMLLLGIALRFEPSLQTTASPAPNLNRWLSPLCSVLALMIGLQTLAEYRFDLSFGLDTLLLINPSLLSGAPHPGRMSYAAAIEFVLLSTSLLLLRFEPRHARRAIQPLAFLSLTIASTALIGYLYGVEALYRVTVYSSMALNTAILFALLSMAILTARPHQGVMQFVTSSRLGGTMARRMLPLVVLVPLAIGQILKVGLTNGWYSNDFGIALYTLVNIVIFVVVVLFVARSMNKIDGAHERANERFHLAVEASPNAMLMIDHEGTIRLSNRRAGAMFGYTGEELVGQPLTTLLPVDKRTDHPSQMANYFRNPTERPMSIGLDLYGLHQNGQLIPVEIGLTPIAPGDSSDNIYVLASVLDITERKRAEQARSHLAAIVQSSEDVIISKHLDGTITSWNHGAEKLFGYTAQEIIGKPITTLIPDYLHEEEARLLVRLRAGEYIAHYETERIRMDGSKIDVALTISPIYDERGTIVGASKIAHDITARKRAEQRLRDSEERFRQIAENIQEVFWIACADNGRILYVSPVYETLWGRSAQNLYASPESWLQAVHPDDRERMQRIAAQCKESNGYDEEYRIVRPDQSICWIRDRAFTICDAHGKADRIVGVAMDITSNRKLEQQLRESQKMEAVGQLAGGIAHDFNNLLSIIAGNTRLAREDLPQDHPASVCLREIDRASSRATDLVRRILTFSRQQPQERKPLKLQPIVEEAIQLLRSTLPSMIEIRPQFEVDAPSALIDPTQIHQIIMNLANNASHAMHEQGVIEFRITTAVVNEPARQVSPELRLGQYVRLSVSDNGEGMDAGVRQRIFEPFFTTKRHGEGTGLGLAVVHGIMQSHDGVITVYSAPGKGTSFHLYFPAVQTEAADTQAGQARVEGGNGQHIMFVDDEEALVFLGKRMLEAIGYRVSGFTSPTTALEAFAQESSIYDLVISDLSMPHMPGTELAQKLLAIRPDIPIVIATGYVRPGVEEQLKSIGVKSLMLKPNTVQDLGTSIHRLFATL